MKKLLAVSLMALLLTALIAAGCGKKTPSASTAQGILEQSTKKTQQVKSVKVSGSYSASMSGTDQSNMQADFEMALNLKNPNPQKPEDVEGRGVIKTMGHDMEIYVVGGVAYINVAVPIESANLPAGWYKQPLDTGTGDTIITTPQEIANISKLAKKISIVSQDSKSYTVAFTIDPKFLEQSLIGSEQFKGMAPEALDMIKSTIGNIKLSARMKVEKSTMLVQETAVKMSLPPTPPVRGMSLDAKMAFSDYNQPVTVVLPPEAQNAQPVPEGAGSLIPGGGFPGLGI